jgi:Ribonuclease G/E
LRRELIIAAGPGEWRAALVDDGSAVELYVERGDRRRAGSIHAGRVVRVAKGLDSAFVEIGDDRPGLAPRRESRGLDAPGLDAPGLDAPGLDEGARVLVEIRREALPDKGPRLTTRLTRPIADPGLDPPAQLYPAPGFAAALALALPGPPDRVVADDASIVPELRTAFPDTEIARETLLDLAAEFAAALAPSLELPAGGLVHIAETRAATMIDVDTGTPETGSAARNALAGNLEAAQAIARHVRLRNLGGGIVVDFVGLEGKVPREQVRQALADALAPDPAKPQCLGWTRLGHIEIVRPYRAPSLCAQLGDPALTQAFAALRAIARAQPAARWRLTVSPRVATALRGSAAVALAALETRVGSAISIVEDAAADPFTIASR